MAGGALGAFVWSVRRTDPHAISRLTHPRGERRGLFRPKRETETGPGRAFGLHSPARAHSGGWLMLGRCHLIRHIESPWRSGERTRPHPRIPYRTTAIGRGENLRLRRGGASRMVVSAWDRRSRSAKTPRNRGDFSGCGRVRAGSLCNSRLVGGESGIRTHGTFRYTRFPSVRLQPLGHLSAQQSVTGVSWFVNRRRSRASARSWRRGRDSNPR